MKHRKINLVLFIVILLVTSCKKEDYKFHYAFKPNMGKLSHYISLWQKKVDNDYLADTLIKNTEGCEIAFSSFEPCSDMTTLDYGDISLHFDMFHIMIDKNLIKAEDSLVFKNMLSIKNKDTLYSLKLQLFFHKLSYKDKSTWVLYNVEANEDFLESKGFSHACYKVNYDVDTSIISNLQVETRYNYEGKSGTLDMRLLHMKIVNDELKVLDITKDLIKNRETPFEINYTEILKCKK